ncbi:MAG: toxin-antitoxin system HicB family antitoxin [Gammaproteobacteria bacterium]|nr:MAG: toxin-antitoxin system HicB family antitoxin [Gammaproteobacteria bacterium]
MMNIIEYPFEMRPLTEEEGGGWLITFPDLPGCMSDGKTPEEAIKNGKDALNCWLTACKEAGRDIPQSGISTSGKFMTRIPKSLHTKLIVRAKQEGVSMNALVSSFIAEGMGRKEATLRQ